MSTLDAATPQTFPTHSRRRVTPLQNRRARWGLLFLTPWFIGFIAFQFLPILSTIYLSFTDYTGNKEFAIENINFVGLKNYARLFTDPQFGQSLGVTLRFVLLAVPLGLIIPLSFAVLLNSKHLIAKGIFRTLFFMPTVIPIVASTFIFNGVLNSQSGWINLSLATFGIQGPRWFEDPNWVLPALNILGVWGLGNAMIILLAGLQGGSTVILSGATMD